MRIVSLLLCLLTIPAFAGDKRRGGCSACEGGSCQAVPVQDKAAPAPLPAPKAPEKATEPTVEDIARKYRMTGLYFDFNGKTLELHIPGYSTDDVWELHGNTLSNHRIVEHPDQQPKRGLLRRGR